MFKIEEIIPQERKHRVMFDVELNDWELAQLRDLLGKTFNSNLLANLYSELNNYVRSRDIGAVLCGTLSKLRSKNGF